MALANMHPLIVRINDVGRAEAIDYRNFQYRPQEAENKYYLTRWAELYFSRNRFTIERDQTNSLYFLNGDVQRAVIDQERKDNIIADYIKDSSLPFVDVEVKNVILDDLRQSPYSARIEFEKVFTNPSDHSELKRERWTASVTYVFRENGEEQRAGRESSRIDHRPLPGRPGVRVDEATSHCEAVFMSHRGSHHGQYALRLFAAYAIFRRSGARHVADFSGRLSYGWQRGGSALRSAALAQPGNLSLCDP